MRPQHTHANAYMHSGRRNPSVVSQTYHEKFSSKKLYPVCKR